MNARTLALAALALAALAAADCTSRRWREADARLEAATADARRAGYQPMSGPYNTFGSFTDTLAATWSVQLDSNTTYVVGIGCTAACSGFGARVAAPGAPLDPAGTAEPAVTFATRGVGAYTVLVKGRCAAGSRCWWVAQVYERGASGRLVPGYDAGKVRRT